MIFQPRKAALYKLAIDYGVQTPEEVSQYLPLGSSVPASQLEGWLKQLFALPKRFSTERRYVNRFKLGADPEFVFAGPRLASNGEPVGTIRTDAASLGLAQGPAFGADNNGRLAEIRPYPSRSAMEVVASILCTLRWMALTNPVLLKYEWLSGAFLWDDGLGGHVHFGRKRPTRKEEVAALDQVEEGLLYLGVYPTQQVVRRRQGDAHRQMYGALGDFRLQAHGYEYRTFPSWLDSPELAFLTLVVSKLAVQMPSLYQFRAASVETERARLRNFLAYFKGVDDDARLALVLLDRGLPTPKQTNFAPRWGIAPDSVARKAAGIQIIPPCIKPDAQSVSEVFDYLLSGKPLTFRVPGVTWSPKAPLKGYHMCLALANTIQAKGLGEMIWDLVCPESRPITFCQGRRGGIPIVFAKDVVKQFPADWQTHFEHRATTAGDIRPGHVYLAPEWREGPRAAKLKRMLLNGLLPVWKAKDCKLDSYRVWLEQAKSKTAPKRKLAGKVVYESQTHKVGTLA